MAIDLLNPADLGDGDSVDSPEERQKKLVDQFLGERSKAEERETEGISNEAELASFKLLKQVRKSDTGLIKAIKYIVMTVAFLMPLFFMPFSSDVLEFNKQMLLLFGGGVGFLIYLIDMVKEGRLLFRKSWIWLVFLGAITATFISSLMSLNSYKSIFGQFGSLNSSLVSIIGYSLIAFLIIALFERREAVQFAISFLGGSALALFLGVIQIFNLHIFPWEFAKNRAFNTVGTSSLLGLLGAISLVLGLALFYRIEGKANLTSRKTNFVYKSIELFSIICALFWLVMLNSWVLWLITIVGVIGVLGLQSLKTGYRMKYYFVPMAIVVIAVFMMLTKLNLPLKSNLPAEVNIAYKASFGIAQKTLEDNFISGYGPENFQDAYLRFKPESINKSSFWNAGFLTSISEFVNTMSESGVLGTVAVLFFIIFPVYRLLQYMIRNTGGIKSRGIKNIGVDIFPVVLSLAVAFFLSPFNVILHFALFFFVAILGLSLSTQEDRMIIDLEASPKYSLISSVMSIVVLIGLIFGFYFGVKRYVANIYFTKAATIEDKDIASQKLIKAINYDTKEDLYLNSLGNLSLTQISDLIQELKKLDQRNPDNQEKIKNIQQSIQNLSALAIDTSKKATDMHAQTAFNWFQRGTIYQNLIPIVSGSDDWAITAFKEYTKLSPQDPRGYLRIGNILLTKSDNASNLLVNGGNLNNDQKNQLKEIVSGSLIQAEDAYKKAIDVKPDYAQAIYSLGVVYERLGKINEAVGQLELTRQSNPFDAGIALELGLLYYRSNQKNEAYQELTRAVQIFPDYSNALWYLALIHEERGEIDQAVGRLDHILELNAGNQLVTDKVNSLKEGKREIPPNEVTDKTPLQTSGTDNN